MLRLSIIFSTTTYNYQGFTLPTKIITGLVNCLSLDAYEDNKQLYPSGIEFPEFAHCWSTDDNRFTFFSSAKTATIELSIVISTGSHHQVGHEWQPVSDAHRRCVCCCWITCNFKILLNHKNTTFISLLENTLIKANRTN